MISFVVITDGREAVKLSKTIECIRGLKIPGAELVVVKDRFLTGQLGRMRNMGCEQSDNSIIVVLDDDIYLQEDFYTGLVKYGDDFDVLSCRILNPDGTRYWDWKTNIDGLNELLEYDQTSPYVSMTGGLTIMHRRVWEEVRWNDDLGFYEAEDVDWSNRVKQAGYRIQFNPHSTVIHDGPYTQYEKWVIKKE